MPGHVAHGQMVFFVVARLRGLIQRRAAGIRHPEHARDLVKALPRRVVARGAENFELCVVLHVHDQAVPAGHDQTHKRRLQLGIGQIIGRDMPADMVHRHERQTQGQRRRLGKIHAHEHRADEPRRIRDRHSVQLGTRELRRFKRVVSQCADRLDVLARRDLRHHAAIQPVQRHLRVDAVRQHLPPVANDGHRRFVARGFDRQNVHNSHSFLRISASSLG